MNTTQANPTDFNNLGDWLPVELKKRQYSIDQFAAVSSVSRGTLYAMLNDTSRPDAITVKRVVIALSKLPVFDGRRWKRVPVSELDMLRMFSPRREGRRPKYVKCMGQRLTRILAQNRKQDNSAEIQRILRENKQATVPKKAGKR